MGKKVLFLVSGNGGTLKFLYKAIQEMNLSFSIVGVLADRDCGALNFAKEKKIPYQKIIYNSYKTDELVPAIKRFQPDIIITTFHKTVIFQKKVEEKRDSSLVLIFKSYLLWC